MAERDYTKKCVKCGATERYKSGACAPCHRWHSKAWRKANPKKHRERSRRWRKTNPEKKLESDRRWKKANPEKVREYGRRRGRVNPEKVYRNNRKWQKANPEKVCEFNQRRRARKRNADGDISAHDWKQLLAHYDNKCLCCGRGDMTMALDHIVPLAKGGDNTIDNAQPLCK